MDEVDVVQEGLVCRWSGVSWRGAGSRGVVNMGADAVIAPDHRNT